MRTDFKFFSLALCVCALGACSDDDSDSTGTGGSGSSDKQYVVMSGSGENNGAYLQTTDDPTTGTLDPANPDGRIFFSGNNPDFVNYNNEILIGMNYPSQGGSSSDYITMAWKLVDGKLTQHGGGVALDGDVKARGIFKNYLIGMSDQATDYDHYERVKFIELNSFGAAVVDGIIDCDDMSKEPQSQMEGETWGVGDIAEFGDYVLLSYSTKHLVKDGASGAKAKATYSTDLANNLYLGVYEFDPTDADKEYLKYQNMIVRKSEDHVGEEAGQIKGNLRSRTETGIEVLGDEIYLFCQGSKNSGKDYPVGRIAHQRQQYSERQTGGYRRRLLCESDRSDRTLHVEMFLHRRQQVLPATLYRKRNGRVRGRIAQGLRYLRREDRAIYSGHRPARCEPDLRYCSGIRRGYGQQHHYVRSGDYRQPAAGPLYHRQRRGG